MKHRDPIRVHLAVAPTKMNERYEWFIEKGDRNRRGSNHTNHLSEQRTEGDQNRAVRKDLTIAAMKQSLHAYLPTIGARHSRFSEFIKIPQEGLCFIAHCEDREKIKLNDHIRPNTSITILIGPEGDFSNDEIEAALKHNYIPVSLGASRLRTETAGIVAAHTIQLCNE